MPIGPSRVGGPLDGMTTETRMVNAATDRLAVGRWFKIFRPVGGGLLVTVPGWAESPVIYLPVVIDGWCSADAERGTPTLPDGVVSVRVRGRKGQPDDRNNVTIRRGPKGWRVEAWGGLNITGTALASSRDGRAELIGLNSSAALRAAGEPFSALAPLAEEREKNGPAARRRALDEVEEWEAAAEKAAVRAKVAAGLRPTIRVHLDLHPFKVWERMAPEDRPRTVAGIREWGRTVVDALAAQWAQDLAEEVAARDAEAARAEAARLAAEAAEAARAEADAAAARAIGLTLDEWAAMPEKKRRLAAHRARLAGKIS